MSKNEHGNLAGFSKPWRLVEGGPSTVYELLHQEAAGLLRENLQA